MSLTSDAMVASDYDIDTFADEFGYAKPSQAIRASEALAGSEIHNDREHETR